MNEFSDLEAQLQQLRPAAPSPEMMKRVEQALEASSTPTAGVLPKPKTRVNWFALGAGLAAAATFLVLARIGTTSLRRNSRPSRRSRPRLRRRAHSRRGWCPMA
jgi:hypothetical protein